MRILNFFIFLSLSLKFALAQENLLPNGDFEKELENWRANIFDLEENSGRNSSICLATDYLGIFDYPSVSTRSLKIEGISGKTLVFSLWVSSNTQEGKVSIKIGAKKNDGSTEYNMEGTNYNTIKGFLVTEEENGWKKLEKELLIPEDIAYLNSVRVQIQQAYIKLDDVQIVLKGEEISAPKDFKAENISQRSVELNWKPEKEKAYVIQLGEESFNLPEGAGSYKFSNLVPGTQYHARVWAVGAEDLVSEIDFSTLPVQLLEGETTAFPYLGNVQNNYIPKTFNYNIVDLPGAKIRQVKILFNGIEATIDAQGNVTLPSFVEGDMKVILTQEDDKVTTINYYNVMIQR